MATWTNPTTRTTGERITQAIWNVDLVENLKYLYDAIVDIISGDKTLSVHTITAAQASLDIQNIEQGGGDLVISGFLRPATNDVGLFLRINNYSGAADYSWFQGGGDQSNDASDSEIALVSGVTAVVGVGNAAGEGVYFNIIFPAYTTVSGSMVRQLTATVSWRRADGAVYAAVIGGALLFAEAVNRVTLLFEAGDIAEGFVRVRRTGKQSV